jgi:hypothetical protein
LQEGRENANIDAGLGFIWRISGDQGLRGGTNARTRGWRGCCSFIGESLSQVVAGLLG